MAVKFKLNIIYLLILVFCVNAICVETVFATESEEYKNGMKISYGTEDVKRECLEIINVCAVRINDDIEFRINFRNGLINYYSFFNPPDGNNIKIIGYPSEMDNKKGIIKIRIPIKKIKKYENITIKIIDEYSADGSLWIKPKKINYDLLPVVVKIPNKNFEKVIRDVIKKDTGDIYKKDLHKIIKLDLSNKEITNLEGIQYLTNLRELNVSNNNIENINFLCNLSNLEVLDLRKNEITSIDIICYLKKLKQLYLEGNTINNYKPLLLIYKNLSEYDFKDKIIIEKFNKGNFKDINLIRENEADLIKYICDTYKDIEEDSEYARSITYLVGMKVMDGYEDKTFKPNGDVNVDTFIKMVVTAMGYELEEGTEYWASTYIDKALELGLVLHGEYLNYNKQITRGEMLKIIIRAMNEKNSKNLNKYKTLISNWDEIPDEYQDFVLKAYSKGIIAGNKFDSNQIVTRAQAANIILRMIDVNSRVLPNI